MRRTVPQLISLVALLLGVALFIDTMLGLDREQTIRQARELGLAFPIVLIPSVLWHLMRAAGWWICFPPEFRPSYWRVFQVRLAADAVGYFTIRGGASEPLRVVLLMSRVPPVVSAAATVLERTAMGIMSVVGVGLFAAFAVSSDMLPTAWQSVFRGIALTALIVLGFSLLFLMRSGRYFGPLIERIHTRTGWHWAGGRTVRIISAVEDLFLKLARTDSQRIEALVALSVACYVVMALEVYWCSGPSANRFPSGSASSSRRLRARPAWPAAPSPATWARSKPRTWPWFRHSAWLVVARWRCSAGCAA